MNDIQNVLINKLTTYFNAHEASFRANKISSKEEIQNLISIAKNAIVLLQSESDSEQAVAILESEVVLLIAAEEHVVFVAEDSNISARN